MATKAERFRANEERSKPAAKKRPKRKAPSAPLTTSAATAEGRRDAKSGKTAARNVSLRAGRKAQVALEDSATKPSRKSTRSAANRGKASANLERASQRARRTPSFRAEASQARGRKVRGGAGKKKAASRR